MSELAVPPPLPFMIEPPLTNIHIQSPALNVEISAIGAELQSIRDADGRDYLHDGTTYWNGRAPLLFPIVGALKDDRHEVDGIAYTLPKHGFARRSTFAVATAAPDRVTFRLEDTSETRAQYPYRFRLDMTYVVVGAALSMTATVTNTDVRPIPVAFGYHPAFCWPLPGAGGRHTHVVDFTCAETGPLTRIDANGLIARTLPSPVDGARLPLTDALFDDDALIFLNLASRSLRFGPADGGSPSLAIAFEGLPYLGIWTKPGGAPFLCIEPWAGYASPTDFNGPLTGKPGSTNLVPGAQTTFTMRVELV